MKILMLLMVLLLAGCTNEGEPCDMTEARLEEETEESTQIIYETENLSTKKESWGMKRKPPQRPEFTSHQMEIMDKYGCIYLGANEKKYLYLTFDEGYENGQTEKILDVLKEKNVKAAFFITGDYFKKEGALIDRMVEENHVVGNHTMNHPNLSEIRDTKKLENEVLSLDLAFFDKYGEHMKFLRAPEGAYSEKVLAVTKNMGYTNVFWSFAYDDWYTDRQRGKAYAYDKTISNIHPGCVILLHAVSKDNAEALGDIIDTARDMGYTFLSLDEYIP